MKPPSRISIALLFCCSCLLAQKSPVDILGENLRIPFSQVAPKANARAISDQATKQISTVTSFGPAQTEGYSQTWEYRLTDPSGPSNIRDLYAIFGNVLSAQNSCFIRIDTQSALLQLANDQGDNWLTSPLSASNASTVANSNCSIASQSLVVANTPTNNPQLRTVSLRITFTRTFFASTVNSFAQVVNGAGVASAWSQGPAAPSPSDIPRVGQNLPPGILRGAQAIPEGRFDVYVQDDFGSADLSRLEITYSDVAPPPTSGNCKVIVDFVNKEFWLVPDSGAGVVTSKFAFNSASSTQVQNGRCQLTANSIQVATPLNSSTSLRVIGRITMLPFVNAPTNIKYEIFDLGNLRSNVTDVVAYNSTGNSPSVTTTSGTPLTLTGSSELISLDTRDFNGAADIAKITLLINSSLNSTGACRVEFDPTSRFFSLVADGGFGYMTGGVFINPVATNPLARQSAANSQCEVFRDNGAGTDFTFSNTNLPDTLRTVFALNFFPAFAGTRIIYAQATDTAGLNSPWVQLGTWSNSAAAAPQVTQIVSSFDGTTSPTSARLNFRAGDLNGAADINYIDVNVDSSNNPIGPGCRVRLQGNVATLIGDNGSFAGQPAIPNINNQGQLVNSLSQNSSCQVIYLGQLGGLSTNSDGTVSYRLNYRLASGYANRNNVFIQAVDQGGLGAGTWTTGPALPPATAGPPSISNYGFGPSPVAGRERFAFNGNTAIALRNVELLIATSVAQASTGCQVYLDTIAGGIFLNNESGGGYQSGVLSGTNNQLANSRCTLFAVNSGRSTTASNTYSFELSTTAGFAAPYNVYARALDTQDQSSGWQLVGTYQRQGGNSANVYQATLNANHPNGAGNLNNIYFLANQTLSNVGGCFLWFDLRANTALLANEAGTAWTVTRQIQPGATLSNSLCDITLGNTPISSAGQTVTMNFTASFRETMVGVNQIYTYSNGLFGWETAWANIGTRTITPAFGGISGALSANTNTTYSGTYTVTHPSSGASVQTLYVIANRNLSNVGGCLVWFNFAAQTMYLANEDGTAWTYSYPFGSAAASSTLSNANCNVTLRQTPNVVGQSVIVPFDITFKVPMSGSQRFYAYAEGPGLNTNWVPMQGVVIP